MPRKPELLFISCVGHHLLTAVIANRRISRPLIFLLPMTFHLHLTVEFLTIVRLASVLKCVLILEKSNPRLHFFKVLLKMTLNTVFYILSWKSILHDLKDRCSLFRSAAVFILRQKESTS